MTRRYSLAHLTVLDLPPPAMIHAAATAGYDAVGLRLLAVTPTTPGYPLMDDAQLMRATKTALRETGLAVNDIEFLRLTPETDLTTVEPLLAAGAELGARHLITAPYDPDRAHLAETLARLADFAAPYGIKPVLEFFPWTNVPDLATAKQVIAEAGHANLGVLLDTLHFDRSGSQISDITADAALFPFFHLCDALVCPPYDTETLLNTARAERLFPGKGFIPLAPIITALPPETPVGLELPMAALSAEIGSSAVAARALVAAKTLLSEI